VIPSATAMAAAAFLATAAGHGESVLIQLGGEIGAQHFLRLAANPWHDLDPARNQEILQGTRDGAAQQRLDPESP